MQNYEEKISQFVDNELPVNEQRELFEFLSENEEARETLHDYMQMKNDTKIFYGNLNADLPKLNIPVPLAAGNEQKNYYKPMFYFSAAASIILLMLLLFNQPVKDRFEERYSDLQSELISLQQEHAELLQSNINLIKQNEKFVSELKMIETAKTVEQKQEEPKPVIKNKKPEQTIERPRRSRSANYLANIPTYQVNDKDFLGSQIVGN